MPVASAAILILAAALPQEAAADSSLRIKDTVEAARRIASDFGLPAYGLKWLERDRARAQSDEDKALLALGSADVQGSLGDRLRDPIQRLKVYAEAGASYATLLESYGSTNVAQDAQTLIGLIAYKYATALEQLYAAGEVSEQVRVELVAGADPFFKAAMKSMNSLIAWWEGLPDESEEKENARLARYYPTQFFRGITYTAWARIYPADSIERERYSLTALEILNEFALQASGVFCFNAYKLAADVHVLRNEVQEAREYYEYVIVTVQEILASPALDLNPYEIGLYEGARMDATLGLLLLDQRLGDEADLQRVLADFDQWQRDNRVVLLDSGWRIRLLQARRLIDQGRISEALAAAQEVARENERNTLRLLANAVMADAIERAPADADISLDVLFQAAEGTQQGAEFERAILLWRALIARLPGTAQESQYLARAYYGLANCWHQVGESLLAGKAAQAGCLAGSSDETLLRNMARQWFSKAETLYRSRSADETLKAWNDEALAFLDSIGGGGEDPAWRNAQNALARADEAGRKAKGKAADSAEAKAALKAYQEAERAFEAIPAGSRYFEKAFVQRGKCAWTCIPWDLPAADRAIAVFKDYLKYIASPTNAPKDATERKFRKESEPEAIYYLGDAWRQLARSGRAGAWEEMLKAFQGFPERFQEEQRDLSDGARDARIEAHLALRQPDAAEKEFLALVQAGAKDKQVQSSAWKLQNFFYQRADQARSESPADRPALLRKTVEYLAIMNQRAAASNGDSLYREAKLLMELGQWNASEKLLSQSLNDAAVPLGERFRFGARADLVECLLQQRRAGQAVPILDELRKEAPKDRNVMRLTVMVKAGFLILEKNQVLEVPGDGQPASLQEALESATALVQIEEHEATTQNLNKFTMPSWWNARVNQIYVYWRLGKIDPGLAETARKIIASLESQSPDLGKAICGDEVPMKLRWLQQR